MRRLMLLIVVASLFVLGLAPAAFGTIHPIVESYDCANEQAFAHHPLEDPANPIGQTPGVGNHSEQSSFRALIVTGPSSPAWFGHKLDGKCGKVGQS